MGGEPAPSAPSVWTSPCSSGGLSTGSCRCLGWWLVVLLRRQDPGARGRDALCASFQT